MMDRQLSAISSRRRAPCAAIETWSSWLAEVGIESTLAGWARCLFSATSAAAVTCGIMKPELSPGLRRQERRQARQRRIDQHGDAPLGQRADLAERQRHDVGGEGDRLGVEVAARQRLAGVGEDQRIVGDAVGLGRQRRRRVAQDVEHGAHDLRLAAQAVGILHALVADQMRGADGGACHQARAAHAAASIWPAMAAQRVDARVERRIGAARRIGRRARR